jgi:hypothetical protein
MVSRITPRSDEPRRVAICDGQFCRLKDEAANPVILILGSRPLLLPNAYGCAESSRFSATLHIALTYRDVRAECNLFTHRRRRAWPANMLRWCRLAHRGLFGTPVAFSRANSFFGTRNRSGDLVDVGRRLYHQFRFVLRSLLAVCCRLRAVLSSRPARHSACVCGDGAQARSCPHVKKTEFAGIQLNPR